GRGGESTAVAAARGVCRGADEREQLLAALEATGWNIMRTASALALSRNTVRARMDRWGLRLRRGPQRPSPTESRLQAPSPSVASAASATPRATDAVRWERRHVTMLRVALAETGDASLHAAHMLGLAADHVRSFRARVQ